MQFKCCLKLPEIILLLVNIKGNVREKQTVVVNNSVLHDDLCLALHPNFRDNYMFIFSMKKVKYTELPNLPGADPD